MHEPLHSLYMELTVKIQGIVLVFDASNQETFDSLAVWKKVVEEKNPPVLLCISNKIDLLDGTDFESLREKWLRW